MERTEGLPAMPPAPGASEAPKKKSNVVKIAGIVVGGLIAVSAISSALSSPAATPAAAPKAPADTTEGYAPAEPTQPDPVTAPEPVEPTFTVSQENAISTAQDYLDYGAFSKSGLIEQLKFEKYSAADAKFAVNHIAVDWNEQAA